MSWNDVTISNEYKTIEEASLIGVSGQWKATSERQAQLILGGRDWTEGKAYLYYFSG